MNILNTLSSQAMNNPIQTISIACGTIALGLFIHTISQTRNSLIDSSMSLSSSNISVDSVKTAYEVYLKYLGDDEEIYNYFGVQTQPESVKNSIIEF